MPYYQDVFNELVTNPPAGWALTHYGDGVYLWPLVANYRMIRPTHIPDIKLWRYQILFEFHRTLAGTARILARARYDMPNRAIWNCFWDNARNVKTQKPKQVGQTKDTRSVAKWGVPNIDAKTTAKDSAQEIRDFLKTEPKSMEEFINTL